MKSNILIASPSLNLGSVSVFPCAINAVGLLCRIMFIRAKPLVAASFSCPYSVTGVRASSATFNSSEPDPQVGSPTVVSALVFAVPIPMILGVTGVPPVCFASKSI